MIKDDASELAQMADKASAVNFERRIHGVYEAILCHMRANAMAGKYDYTANLIEFCGGNRAMRDKPYIIAKLRAHGFWVDEGATCNLIAIDWIPFR